MKVAPRALGNCLAHSTGFTLVELMVVLSVLAMLLALSLPRFAGSTETAKQQVRAQNLATLRDALDKFRADQGRYPQDLAELAQRKYVRGIPLDPVSGTRQWQLVTNPSGMEVGIYDVLAPDDVSIGLPSNPASAAATSAPASGEVAP